MAEEATQFELPTALQEMAENIKIHYHLEENSLHSHVALVTVTNSADSPTTATGWVLYFCSLRKIETTTYPKVILSHINGCLHKITPRSKSTTFAAGETLSLRYTGSYFIGAKCFIMPNWYLTGPGDEVRVITNTADESLSFVDDFKTAKQWKRSSTDRYDPYVPQTRYDVIGVDPPREEGDAMLVIPQPLHIANLDRTKRLTIDRTWKIYADKGLNRGANLLKAKYKLQTEAFLPARLNDAISLKIGNPDVTTDGSKIIQEEAYSLIVNLEHRYIEITGQAAQGVFYGVQTLLALADQHGTVPMVTIKDAPRYSYRGMHLDVGRNFKSKSAVLRLLDVMAMYKLNKFHFHLTDDEGWRLEIPGLPELTTIGARRCHDLTGRKCIQPELGADPTGLTPLEYYTTQDYTEILQYADDRHIQVIPEFDMPGHGYAAIKAMEARYHKLIELGNKIDAEKYLLSDLEDKSLYTSSQNFYDNAINPCLESTYRFISHLVKAVVRIHSDVQPLTTYHFGGDEVPSGAWERSPACERLELDPKSFNKPKRIQLKEYFIKRVATITADLGLDLGGWEDAFESQERRAFANKQVFANAWNNLPYSGGGKSAYTLANAGYKVIMTQASHLYFDHPHEPDPEELGNHWATRFTSTRAVFGFLPENVYANLPEHSQEEFCQMRERCIALTERNNIIGMSGALWTEVVRTADHMDSMLFPRLLALAERAWHKASWEDNPNTDERNGRMNEDWTNFSSFIANHELPRLDKLQVKYRVPPPGASFTGSQIKVRTALPGLPVQFSKDGGKTWNDVTEQTRIEGRVSLVTMSSDRKRKSRVIEAQSPIDHQAK